MASELRREDLSGDHVTLLHRGHRRNPDVLLVRRPSGPPLVVKDFAPRGALVRALVGPVVARREARAYRALAGHPAVPAFRGWIDRLAFAVEYRPGRRMSRKLRGRVPADFPVRLEGALAEMHARGVAHLDLRHRSNVLVAEDGSPVLIDFGSAVCFRPGGVLSRTLLPLLARIDRGAAAKWRVRLGGGEEPPDPEGPGCRDASPRSPGG